MYQLVYSKLAEKNIEDIGTYLEEHAGFLVARAVIRRIITRAESLSDMPYRFAELPELKPGLHMTHTDGYLIFYTIHEQTVNIVTIVNGRQNITDKMFKDEI